MANVKVQKVGGAIPLSTTAMAAPTIFVDNVASLSADQNVIKISFVENLSLPDGSMAGRHVLNMALTAEALGRVMETLQKALANVEEARNADA